MISFVAARGRRSIPHFCGIVSCTLKTFRGKQDHAQEIAVRQALGHPKTGDEITRTPKKEKPHFSQSAREMGHPLSLYFFTVLGTLRPLAGCGKMDSAT